MEHPFINFRGWELCYKGECEFSSDTEAEQEHHQRKNQKWGLGWDGVIFVNQVQNKRRLRPSQMSLDPSASSLFPLLPAPRWIAVHLCLYHCQHNLEGLSSSAFQVCCFLSPHSPLGPSALGTSDSPPEMPHQRSPSQDPEQTRACASTQEWVHE